MGSLILLEIYTGLLYSNLGRIERVLPQQRSIDIDLKWQTCALFFNIKCAEVMQYCSAIYTRPINRDVLDYSACQRQGCNKIIKPGLNRLIVEFACATFLIKQQWQILNV